MVTIKLTMLTERRCFRNYPEWTPVLNAARGGTGGDSTQHIVKDRLTTESNFMTSYDPWKVSQKRNHQYENRHAKQECKMDCHKRHGSVYLIFVRLKNRQKNYEIKYKRNVYKRPSKNM